jgi:hypothetical protein
LQGSLLEHKPENAAATIKLLHKVGYTVLIAIRFMFLKYWLSLRIDQQYLIFFLDSKIHSIVLLSDCILLLDLHLYSYNIEIPDHTEKARTLHWFVSG